MVQVYYSPHEQHFQKEPKCTTNNTISTPDTEPSLRDLNRDRFWLCVTHGHNLEAVQNTHVNVRQSYIYTGTQLCLNMLINSMEHYFSLAACIHTSGQDILTILWN
jgi:hypothetical protein